MNAEPTYGVPIAGRDVPHWQEHESPFMKAWVRDTDVVIVIYPATIIQQINPTFYSMPVLKTLPCGAPITATFIFLRIVT